MQTVGDSLVDDEIDNSDIVQEVAVEQAAPQPDVTPVSETVLTESEPQPMLADTETPIELVENIVEPFDYDTLTLPKKSSYVPRGTSIPAEGPEGSIIMASLSETAIGAAVGSVINRPSSDNLLSEDDPNFRFIEFIPFNRLEQAEYYALAKNQQDIDDITVRLDREDANNALMAANPYASFIASIPAQALDPINALPGGVIFNTTKKAMTVGKAAIGVSTSAVASGLVQEAVLHNEQLTRTLEDSIWNVTASAVLGGALGVGAGKIGQRIDLSNEKVERARSDLIGEYVGRAVEMKANGTISDAALENMPDFIQATMKISPLARLKSSAFDTAKWFADLVLEHNWNTVKNAKGLTEGVAVETRIKGRERKHATSILEYENEYYKMNGITSGPFKGTRAKLKEPVMGYDQYAKAVARVMITTEQDLNPHVNKGAEHLNNVIDDILQDLVAQGRLPEGVTPKTAPGYFTQIYNVDKIVEQGGRNARGEGTFPQAVYNGFKQSNTELRAFKESASYKEIESEMKLSKDALKHIRAERTILPKNAEVKEKISKLAKKDIDKMNDAILELKKIKRKKQDLKDAAKAIKERRLELQERLKEIAPKYALDDKGRIHNVIDSDDVLWQNAMQTVDRILSMQGDELLNPVLGMLRTSPRQLKGRVLMIDQTALTDWTIQDPARVVQLYSRALTPEVELGKLAQSLGYKDLAGAEEGISLKLKAEYDVQSKGKTGKEAQKLKRQLEIARNDMISSLQILRGVYGEGGNTILTNGWAKFFRNFRMYNSMRMLGGMVISSVPDVALHVLRNGVFKTLFNGLVPMLQDFKGIAKADLRAIGYGMESELGMRIRAYIDHDGLTSNPGLMTKAFDTMTQGFGNLTLMNQWNSWHQRLAGRVSIHRTIDTIHRIKEGKKVTIKDKKRLAQLGLKEEYFDYIYSQTKGNLDETGTYYADWTQWNVASKFEADALQDFQYVTAKDIDSVVIMPGAGDKPLWGNTAWGKSLLQFKSFMFSATNKVLYSSIQRKADAETWLGLSSMIAMGAVSYVTSSYLRGKEPDLSYANLAKESIDRSGALGVIMEVIDIGTAMGIVPGKTVSRYDSRGIYGAMVGPTGGTIADTISLVNRAANVGWGNAEFTTSDVQSFFRLFPYQNMSYLQYLNKMMVTEIGEAYGLEETRKGK